MFNYYYTVTVCKKNGEPIIVGTSTSKLVIHSLFPQLCYYY